VLALWFGIVKAIRLANEETFQTIWLGLGRATSDADTIADILIDGIRHFRESI
jgi:hypothetical protein